MRLVKCNSTYKRETSPAVRMLVIRKNGEVLRSTGTRSSTSSSARRGWRRHRRGGPFAVAYLVASSISRCILGSFALLRTQLFSFAITIHTAVILHVRDVAQVGRRSQTTPTDRKGESVYRQVRASDLLYLYDLYRRNKKEKEDWETRARRRGGLKTKQQCKRLHTGVNPDVN